MDFLLQSPVTYLILLVNVIVSFKGFQDSAFLERYLFKPFPILRKKEYSRLVTSGFLHADWMHLIFNMYSFHSFGGSLEQAMGSVPFAILYFLSLIGGNLLSLLLHHKEANYSALGASGAVSGVIFAAIVAFPDMKVGIFLFPNVSGWVFALIYTLFSLYGIRSSRDNIGHDAHLGGAIIGSLTLVGFFPILLDDRLPLLATIILPSAIFLFLVVRYPHILGMAAPIPTKPRNTSDADIHYNSIRAEKQKELNRILDKINETGIQSLSDYEKRFLDMNQ